MVLNNLKKLMAAITNSGTTTCSLKQTDGGMTTGYENTPWRNWFNTETVILLGSGSTAPKVSDYALNAEVTSSLTSISRTNTPGTTENYMKDTTQVYQNNTSNSITINEVGLAIYIGMNNKYILLTRKVLESPVIMAPGETYAFNVTLKS